MRTIVLFMTLLAAASVLADNPELQPTSKVYNVGRVVVPGTVVHSMWLRATGPDSVAIKDIKSGCECVVVTHNGQKVAPGDSILITVKWELGVRTGLNSRLIRIFTSDSMESSNILYEAFGVHNLEGTNTVSMRPFRFEFTQIGDLRRDTIAFTLTNESDADILVTPLTEIPEDVDVLLPDTLAPKEVFNGRVALGRASVIDTLFPSLILQFDSKDRQPERITIPMGTRVYRRPAG